MNEGVFFVVGSTLLEDFALAGVRTRNVPICMKARHTYLNFLFLLLF